METTTTTTTLNPDIYRFNGIRYGLRAPDNQGFNDVIPQETGLYTFPAGDQVDVNDEGRDI